jgi:GNAT superfamily N-acetyltransferase
MDTKMKSINIELVNYEPKYRKVFRDLNKEWIDKYFVMEEADYKALDNPDEDILNDGGCIIVALLEGVPIGVCAMKKMKITKHDYELAKMAVAPKYHGLGAGKLLGQAIIDKAKSLNAKSLFLESNTILEPAINLYRKLGFIEIHGVATPYERSNIQMELKL